MDGALLEGDNYSYERFFAFLPFSGFRCRQQLVSCSNFISVFGCQPTWVHQILIEPQ